MLGISFDIGSIVVMYETSIITGFWPGIYFFFIRLDIHHPVETANAPMNNPITMLLTPSHAAPPAAAAAPSVHKGQ